MTLTSVIIFFWLDTAFRDGGFLHLRIRSLSTNCVPMSFPFSVFITAVSLQAQNAPKQTSIELSITWNGPTELLHGIFQGYEIFYRDTNSGKEFNVTLRTSDTFTRYLTCSITRST